MKVLSIFLSITLISIGLLSAQTDAETDALLEQILGNEAVTANPAAAPAPAPTPKPVAPPAPAPQRRVVIPGPTQATPQVAPAESAVMQQIQQEIRQSGEVDSLQARIREINGFGKEPSENAPERRPQPNDPPVRRLTNPVPDAPVRSSAEPPREMPVDEGVTPAPEVRESPSTFASPPTNVPAPPAFESSSASEIVGDESTPPPTPQATPQMALPSWNETVADENASVAASERLTDAQQNPFGSPRGVEQPAAEKSGFFGKLFGKKDQPTPAVATVATAMPAEPTQTPVEAPPELPKPNTPAAPAVVAPEPKLSNATEIASVGQEPETTGAMILPSARIPAAEAKDPERLIESGSTPPLLKPLNLDWLSGSSGGADDSDIRQSGD